MAIELPTAPGIRSARVRLVDWGSDITPVLGGPVQRLSRMGSRYAVDVMLPPMREDVALAYLSKLRRAKEEGAVFAFPQYGLEIGSPGSPKVRSAVTGGTSLPLKGFSAGYVLREGQYFSIVHEGHRYVHSADEATAADGSGNMDVTITPMLRTALSVDDLVEVAAPKIEGRLQGNEVGWDVMTEPFAGVQFTIMESR